VVTQIENDTRFHGFPTRREVWSLGEHPIEMTWPASPDALLDLPSTYERFARNEYMPYWAQPWPASVLLAEHILRGEPGRGREAVELGCGIGLVSVAAGLAGWRMTASDYDEDALAFAGLNASRNGVTLAGQVRIDFVEQSPSRRFDAVFAADILYERRLGKPVARWIAAALKPGGYALIGDPNRSAADEFVAHAAENGLQTTVSEATSTAPAGLLTRGRIWKIIHRAG
jgi:predicted nicotinamide N-methyase